MVKARRKAFEEITSPGGNAWRVELKPGSKSGYVGVIPVKGKWQARGYDCVKQQQRSLPGLFNLPQDAAVQVAKFAQYFSRGGEKIPSPKKVARRGTGMIDCLHVYAVVYLQMLFDSCLQGNWPKLSRRR